jgi:hypothetical protein
MGAKMSRPLDFVLYTIDERSKTLLSHGTGKTMKPISRSVKPSNFSLNERISSDLATSVFTQAMTESISLSELIKLNHLEPLSVAASLAVIGLESNNGLGPTLKTSRPLDLRWKPLLMPLAWSEVLPNASVTDCLNLSSGLLQIYDFWEESHECAQTADDQGEKQISAHWHAICHRREPDPGNANYWWAKVRNNRISNSLVEIIAATESELTEDELDIAKSLIDHGKFNHRMMTSNAITACSGSGHEKFLRRVQKYELFFMFNDTIGLLH